MSDQQEGVIKYDLTFVEKPLEDIASISALNAWRSMLWQLALIGQDDNRYLGYGFGNVSQRVRGQGFLISGTQTGAIETLEAAQYALVKTTDFASNHVSAEGTVKPSSESLTHALIFELCPTANVVLHVHSPVIWQYARQLNVPETVEGVDYGTIEMVEEVKRLFNQQLLQASGVFSMRGHEDGIVAYGVSPEQAGIALLGILAKCLTIR